MDFNAHVARVDGLRRRIGGADLVRRQGTDPLRLALAGLPALLLLRRLLWLLLLLWLLPQRRIGGNHAPQAVIVARPVIARIVIVAWVVIAHIVIVAHPAVTRVVIVTHPVIARIVVVARSVATRVVAIARVIVEAVRAAVAVAVLPVAAGFDAARAGGTRRRGRRHQVGLLWPRHKMVAAIDTDNIASLELRARQHGHAVAMAVPAAVAAIAAIVVTATRRKRLALVAPAQALLVAGRHPVARHEAVARRERVPAQARALVRMVDAAHPAHQRRRPHRAAGRTARRPVPALAHRHPAAVVRRRIAPGRVIDPGPAPRRQPGPAAVAVRRPVGADIARRPQGTVLDVLGPAAVAVQFFVAGHAGGNVLSGDHGLGLAVALVGPDVEAIAPRHGRAHIGGGDIHLAARADRHRGTGAIDARSAGQHADLAGVGQALHVHPQQARLDHGDARLRRGQFEVAQQVGIAHPDADTAVIEAQAQQVVVELGNFEIRVGVEPHRGGAETKLGTGAAGGDQVAVGGDWPVEAGGYRFILAAQGDLALHRRNASHRRRQVGLGLGQGAPAGQHGQHDGGDEVHGVSVSMVDITRQPPVGRHRLQIISSCCSAALHKEQRRAHAHQQSAKHAVLLPDGARVAEEPLHR